MPSAAEPPPDPVHNNTYNVDSMLEKRIEGVIPIEDISESQRFLKHAGGYIVTFQSTKDVEIVVSIVPSDMRYANRNPFQPQKLSPSIPGQRGKGKRTPPPATKTQRNTYIFKFPRLIAPEEKFMRNDKAPVPTKIYHMTHFVVHIKISDGRTTINLTTTPTLIAAKKKQQAERSIPPPPQVPEADRKPLLNMTVAGVSVCRKEAHVPHACPVPPPVIAMPIFSQQEFIKINENNVMLQSALKQSEQIIHDLEQENLTLRTRSENNFDPFAIPPDKQIELRQLREVVKKCSPDRVQEMMEEIEELKETRQALSYENERLKQQAPPSIVQTDIDLFIDLGLRETQLSEINEEIRNREAALKKLDENIRDAEETLKKLAENIQTAEGKLKTLDENARTTEALWKSKNEEIVFLSKNFQELNECNAGLNRNIETRQIENENIDKINEELRKEEEALRQRRLELERINEEMENSIQLKRRKLEEMDTGLKEKQSMCDAADLMYFSKKEEVESLQNESVRLSLLSTEQQKEIEELASISNDRRKMNIELLAITKERQLEVERLSTIQEDYNMEIERLSSIINESHFERLKKDQLAEIEQLRKIGEERQLEIERLGETLMELDKKKENEIDTFEKLKAFYSDAKDQIFNDLNHQRTGEMMRRIEQLEKQLSVSISLNGCATPIGSQDAVSVCLVRCCVDESEFSFAQFEFSTEVSFGTTHVVVPDDWNISVLLPVIVIGIAYGAIVVRMSWIEECADYHRVVPTKKHVIPEYEHIAEFYRTDNCFIFDDKVFYLSPEVRKRDKHIESVIRHLGGLVDPAITDIVDYIIDGKQNHRKDVYHCIYEKTIPCHLVQQ